MTMKILLVEDDADMSKALVRALGKRGFDVSACADGTLALKKIRDEADDLVILDLNIPGLDGLHILQRIRAQGIATPVIVLTARGAVGDRVAGLNAGADDYLAKPFDLEELEARIHALLRRKGGAEASRQKCGQLCFERSSGAFYHDDEPLEFTPREQALLKALMARPGHAVKRERLLQLVFPEDANVQVEAIEVVIHRLRKKLVATQTEIMTLRGLGYLLRAVSARSA
jgi:DNA-binding response OmpR family regulator